MCTACLREFVNMRFQYSPFSGVINPRSLRELRIQGRHEVTDNADTGIQTSHFFFFYLDGLSVHVRWQRCGSRGGVGHCICASLTDEDFACRDLKNSTAHLNMINNTSRKYLDQQSWNPWRWTTPACCGTDTGLPAVFCRDTQTVVDYLLKCSIQFVTWLVVPRTSLLTCLSPVKKKFTKVGEMWKRPPPW